MTSFDFQSYIARRKPLSKGFHLDFQNYAYDEDMRRLRQLTQFSWAKQAFVWGLQAWKLAERSRIFKSGRPIANDARASRLWLECCRHFDVSPSEVIIMPKQTTYFEAYGDDKEVFFALSADALGLPSSALRFVFGCGIGAQSNGHIPLQTLHRFADGLSRGVTGRATAMFDHLLHWERVAAITRDRAGLLASRDISAAILAMTKEELDWNDQEILSELRRYHEGLSCDWGSRDVERRIRALERFQESELYGKDAPHPGRPKKAMDQVDEEVRGIYAIFQ